MILYVKILKIPHIKKKKLLKLTNLLKWQNTKANTEKIQFHFSVYNNEQFKKEITETILFTETILLTIASKRLKYLGVNQEKDLYNDNYKY